MRRSIDARSNKPRYKLLVNVFVNESPQPFPTIEFKPVKDEKKIIIVVRVRWNVCSASINTTWERNQL